MTTLSSRTSPVLVCVDGSEGAVAATEFAADYANRVHAPLMLVHAVPDRDWYGSAAFTDGGSLEDELRRLGRGYLDRASKAALAVAPALVVESVSAVGTIAQFVASIRALLIVLGTRKSGPVRDVLLGRNAIRIINHAQCPVLIRRGAVDPRLPVVVGVDGSDESGAALLAAMEMADTLGLPVVAANFWGVAADVGAGLGSGYVDWTKVRDDERLWLDAHVAPVREKYPNVALTTMSTDSRPARGLRSLAVSASMVVVGSHGRGATSGVILGSVSQNMVHHAECNVLVVR